MMVIKMNHKKMQIFKIQKSLTGETMLIYNKKRTYMCEIPYDHNLDSLFNDKQKIYVLGFVDANNKLAIENKVSERSW